MNFRLTDHQLKAYLESLEVTVFQFENLQAFHQGAETHTHR